MKKLALVFFGMFLVLGVFANAQESNIAQKNSVENSNTQNTPNQAVDSKGFGYYVDTSADFIFLWPKNVSSGGATSWDGTRNNSDSFLDFQPYFSIGPTYSFGERFSLGARIGVGIQSLMVEFHKKEYSCDYGNKTSPCGWKNTTSYDSIDTNFVLPLALDARYSFKKDAGIILGGEYDMGATMDVFKVYSELYLHPFALKFGWIPYSKISDKVIDKALQPSAGRTSIDLGDGKSSGFFLALSYMIW